MVELCSDKRLSKSLPKVVSNTCFGQSNNYKQDKDLLYGGTNWLLLIETSINGVHFMEIILRGKLEFDWN